MAFYDITRIASDVSMTAGSILPSPNAANPIAAHWLMVVGVAILGATAIWAIGGLVAAFWALFAGWMESRRDHHHPQHRQARAGGLRTH